jgi:argininosuccinate lyase
LRGAAQLCPLGSGAVAGATLALDRTIAARELGFTAPTANSMDATSDRDFILEYLQALTFVGLHLSRFAEEITLFATAEFGFVTLPEAFSTGSSAMPQKKNPDLTELIAPRSAAFTARRRRSRCNSKACRWPTIKTCRRRRSRHFAVELCAADASAGGALHRALFNSIASA